MCECWGHIHVIPFHVCISVRRTRIRIKQRARSFYALIATHAFYVAMCAFEWRVRETVIVCECCERVFMCVYNFVHHIPIRVVRAAAK